MTAIEASTENGKLVELNARLNKVAIKVLQLAISDSFGMAFLERTQQSNKTVRPLDLNAATSTLSKPCPPCRSMPSLATGRSTS